MTLYRVPIAEKTWGWVVFEADTLEEAKRILDEGELDGSEQYYYNVTEVDFEIDGVELDE